MTVKYLIGRLQRRLVIAYAKGDRIGIIGLQAQLRSLGA